MWRVNVSIFLFIFGNMRNLKEFAPGARSVETCECKYLPFKLS